MTSSQAYLKGLRKYQKRLLNHVIKNEAGAAKELLEDNTHLLKEKFPSPYFKSILYIGRVDLERITKEKTLYSIIDVGYHKLEENADRLFFYAAKCDIKGLERLFSEITNADDLNKVREGDTPLMFFIRFADYKKKSFIPCAEMLVAKLDVNIADYENCTPILKSCYFYITLTRLNSKKDERKYRKKFEDLIKIILKKGDVDIDSHRLHEKTARDYMTEHIPNVLSLVVKKPLLVHPDAFALLKAKNERQFILANIMDHNIHDGENTLLQLACILNLPTAVSYLISRKARINDTPARNKDTPLEIAAKRGHSDIFNFMLNHINEIKTNFGERIVAAFENGEIDRNHFLKASEKFVKGFVSMYGNTPLHYAVKLSSKESVHHFLNKDLYLLTENNCNVRPLQNLNTDMANYAFNRFITKSIISAEECVKFDYRALYKQECSNPDMLEVLNEIAELETLTEVLQHPLIKSYTQVHYQGVINLLSFITVLYVSCHLAFITRHINYSSFSQSQDMTLLDWLWLFEIPRAPMDFFRCVVAHQDKENQLNKLLIYGGISFICNFFTFPSIRSSLWDYRKVISCLGISVMAVSIFQWLLYVPRLSKYIHMAERVVKNYVEFIIAYSIIILVLGAICFALTKEPSIEPAQTNDQNCSIDFLLTGASFPENISVTSSLNETCNCVCKTATRDNVTCSILCNEVSDLELPVFEDILDIYTDVLGSSEAKWKSIRGWGIKVLFVFIVLLISAAISNLIQAVAVVDAQEAMDSSKLHELMSKLSFLRLSRQILKLGLPYIRPNEPPRSIQVNKEGKIVKFSRYDTIDDNDNRNESVPDEYQEFCLDPETLRDALKL